MNKAVREARWVRIMLEQAEQGQSIEVIAQTISSIMVSGTVSPQETVELFNDIYSRVDELLDVENCIWEGLLPGPTKEIDRHQYELAVWLAPNRCYMTQDWNGESDLNIAFWAKNNLLDIQYEFVTLIHVKSGDSFLYTNEMCHFIVAAQEAEAAANVLGFELGNTEYTQGIHEMAIQKAAEFFETGNTE